MARRPHGCSCALPSGMTPNYERQALLVRKLPIKRRRTEVSVPQSAVPVPSVGTKSLRILARPRGPQHGRFRKQGMENTMKMRIAIFAACAAMLVVTLIVTTGSFAQSTINGTATKTQKGQAKATIGFEKTFLDGRAATQKGQKGTPSQVQTKTGLPAQKKHEGE